MIYLDNAASTRPATEVAEAVARVSRDHFANPSSAHAWGAAAARVLEDARGRVAACLGAEPGEIVFTSGGTEADALAVIGAAAAARGRHLVVSALEHPAVLRTVEQLASRGHEVTRVPPLPSGAVAAEAVAAATRPDTAVVAVMLVNNEIGTLQPIEAIAAAVATAGRRVHFHVDAVQGFGFLPLDVRRLGADSVAVSSHKLHGPKGAGALWVKPRARVLPLWDGGRQERGLRSGTENLPGWVGLATAAELATAARRGGSAEQVARLRDRFEAAVFTRVPGARATVIGAPRAPHIASIAIPELPAEPLLHALEARGVIASAGSACATRDSGPSHVLRSVGVDERTAVLRFSFSRETTEAEVDDAVPALVAAVDEIRSTTPRPPR